MEQIINKLKQKLQEPLPGESVQYQMAPVNRKKFSNNLPDLAEYRPSAVMIVICRSETGDLFIPLTERFDYGGAHSGQISLPGGKFEEADETLINTAIRECKEEIGIGEGINLLGSLSEVYIPVSKFMVKPVVGFYQESAVWRKNEREVKSIIELKLNTLFDDGIVKEGQVMVQGNLNIKAPYFDIEGFKVWGATAMILNEFKTIAKTIF